MPLRGARFRAPTDDRHGGVGGQGWQAATMAMAAVRGQGQRWLACTAHCKQPTISATSRFVRGNYRAPSRMLAANVGYSVLQCQPISPATRLSRFENAQYA